MAESDTGLGSSLLKCVEIHHHHIDGLDAVCGDGGFVFGVATDIKQTAVDKGMKGFYATVEHLGKAGQIADVLYCQAGSAQCLGGSAGGDQFNAKAGKGLGEVDQAGLIGDAEQGAANPLGLLL